MKFCLFVIFFSSSLFANQKSFPAGEINSIVIKAVHLKLQVRHKSSDNYSIKWTGKISFQLENGVLNLQSDNFNSIKSWKSNKSPSPTLEISGPSVPVELFSYSSQSFFSLWTKPVFVSSFKGTVKSLNHKAPLNIHLNEGSITINKQKGPLLARGFNIKSSIDSSEGEFRLYLNEGSLNAKKSKGDLHFTTNKAKVKIKQFKGNLKGFSYSGPITAQVEPNTVELLSEKSSLRLSFIKHAPTITAYTEKGKIYGANYLNKQFSGQSIKVTGRMQGQIKKGEVSLKTETGNIYIN